MLTIKLFIRAILVLHLVAASLLVTSCEKNVESSSSGEVRGHGGGVGH